MADIFNKYYLSLADYDCDYDGLDTASITDIIWHGTLAPSCEILLMSMPL